MSCKGSLPPLFDRMVNHDIYYLDDAELVKSVKKELMLMLNVRSPLRSEELKNKNDFMEKITPYTLGIPDFTFYGRENKIDWDVFSKSLSNLISIFDPRIKKSNVDVLGFDPKNCTLRLNITGEIDFIDGKRRTSLELSLKISDKV